MLFVIEGVKLYQIWMVPVSLKVDTQASCPLNSNRSGLVKHTSFPSGAWCVCVCVCTNVCRLVCPTFYIQPGQRGGVNRRGGAGRLTYFPPSSMSHTVITQQSGVCVCVGDPHEIMEVCESLQWSEGGDLEQSQRDGVFVDKNKKNSGTQRSSNQQKVNEWLRLLRKWTSRWLQPHGGLHKMYQHAPSNPCSCTENFIYINLICSTEN